MSSKTIKSLKLPKAVADIYETQCGITTVFDWQHECLTTTGVLNGRNLVFSAPTSAGKTLVAELVMIKRILDNNKKCIFILPFVSVVREKVYYMKKLFKKLGIRVEGFMGGEQPNGGLTVCDIAICTIEKANSLVNRLIADGALGALGMVIVDELHMVGDPNRGYLLELLLTKLIFIMRQKNDKELCHTQILGMSATLPNLDVIAKWLDASLYNTDFRPVPLQECLKMDNRILTKDNPENTRIIHSLNLKQIVDEDHLISLCYETVSDGHSVLIFCPTKIRCEKLTITIAKGFHFVLEEPVKSLSDEQRKEQRERFHKILTASREQYEHFTKQLKNCPVGLDKLLNDTLYYGVAYHHAGLTFDERDVIEAGFRSGAIRVLIATSTLSSGVNLPARRVIIRTPVFNGSLLDTLSYKQMCGRAGRKGVDNFGESILICKQNEKLKGESLMNSQLKRVESCLDFSSGVTNALKRALLEIIAAGIAKTEKDLEVYFESTLLHAASTLKVSDSSQFILSGFQSLKSQNLTSEEGTSNEMMHPVSVCVSYLENFEFIRFHEQIDQENAEDVENGQGENFTGQGENVADQNRLLYPTQLGVAALSSSFPPHQSLMVFAELQRARRNFCLDDDLHLVYLVTPLYCHEVSANMEWMTFMSMLEALPPSSKRIARLVGIEEGFIAKAVRGTINMNSGSDRTKIDVHKRFYSALVLLDLINEVPLNEVSAKFTVSRGQLQTLQQSAATFSGMVTIFCHRLGWKNLAMLLGSFQSRLNFGVHQELVELVRISVLNAQRARLLFSAGYHTIVHLANAQVEVLEQVLYNRTPFKSKKSNQNAVAENPNVTDSKPEVKKQGIWVVGSKNALTEKQAAEIIITEAKQLVCDDLRLMGINLMDQEREDPIGGSGPKRGRSSGSINRSQRRSRVSLIDKSIFDLNHSNSTRNTTNMGRKSKAPANRSRQKTRSKSKSNVTARSKSCSNASGTESDAEPPAKKSSFEVETSAASVKSPKTQNVRRSSIVLTSFNEKLSDNEVTEVIDASKVVDDQSKSEIYDCSKDASVHIVCSQKRSRGSSILPSFDFSFRRDDIEMSSTPFQSKSKSVLPMQSFGANNVPDRSADSLSLLQTSRYKEEGSALSISDKIPANKSKDDETQTSMNKPEKSVTSLTDSLLMQLCDEQLQVKTSEKSQIGEMKTSVTQSGEMGREKIVVGNDNVKKDGNDVKKEDEMEKKENSAPSLTDSLLDQLNESCLTEKPRRDSNVDVQNREELKPAVPVISNQVIKADDEIPKVDNQLSGNLFSCQESVSERSPNVKAPENAASSPELVNQKVPIDSCSCSTELMDSLSEAVQGYDLGNDNGEDLKYLGLNQINSSQDILFEQFEEFPPNQLNSSLDERDENTSALSCAEMVNTSRVFEPSENSMLLDSDMLTQALFESVGVKHSFCEEPIEVPTTPHKGKAAEANENLDEEQKNFTKRDDGTTTSRALIVIESNMSDDHRSSNKPFQIVNIGNSISRFENFRSSSHNAEFISIAVYKPVIAMDTSVYDFEETGDDSNQEIISNVAKAEDCSSETSQVVTVSVCLGENSHKVFQFDLKRRLDSENDQLFAKVSNWIKNLFTSQSICRNVVCFDGKNILKTVSSVFSIRSTRPLFDIGLASWVLDSSEKDFGSSPKSVSEICSTYDPDFKGEDTIGSELWSLFRKTKSFGRSENSELQKNFGAVLVFLSARTFRFINKKLKSMTLDSYFLKVESKMQLANFHLEQTGFTMSDTKYKRMRNFCVARIENLKKFAFSFTGKEFSLSSPEEVSFALYFDLKLPPNGDPENLKPSSNFQKVLGLKKTDMRSKRSNGKLKLPPEFNTRNETLMKLKEFHVLPSIIIEFRKIKILLNKICSFASRVDKNGRLKSTCDCLSETGRMSFKEPNIQNVPKSFELINLNPRKLRRSTRKRSPSSENAADFTELNCRDLFIPCSEDFILVGADYSQLELRILAHFSEDETLLEFLNGGGDVFKSIAGVWKNIDVSEVTDSERSDAKQMCYGIVYGMGAKALSEQLNTSVSDAEKFIRSFRLAFPTLFEFVNKTVEFCQKHEYIETICGRRRYLSEINSNKPHKKSHAERQAVNSRIQGSASEILKLAIVNINRQLLCRGFKTIFDYNGYPSNGQSDKHCVLVLHLHDEVIYETERKNLCEVVMIIREEMQSVLKNKLKVNLPVKVKSGESWGQLAEID
ncbi:DNA polymerase theta-like [Convolutriloba macropyga]|uniref:DNA polymerase theta-like n=1 Tax=Convolutriloba macropyga TaxID=536237 RepID=UPI003F524136